MLNRKVNKMPTSHYPLKAKTSRSLSPVFSILLSLMLLVSIIGCAPKTKKTSLLLESSEYTLYEDILKREKLSAGVKYETPPFGSLSADGHLHGYDIDLIKEIGKRLSKKHQRKIVVDFHQVLPSTRIVGLNLGKVDLVAATMTITPQRKKLIDFSNQYFLARQGIIVKRDSKFKKLADLDNATILYVMGTTSEHNIRKALPDATFRGFKTTTAAYDALKNGDGDALTNDDIILYALMKNTCDFKMLKERLSQEPYGLGIRKNSMQQSTLTFRKAINKILNEIKADGTLKKLEDKWIAPLKDKSHCK